MSLYKQYRISQGDTIQKIAQQEMGHVSDWLEIIEYNGLHYPYLVDSNEEKLKDPEHLVTVGDMITIPKDVSFMDVDAKNMGRRDRETVMNLVLGKDLDISGKEEGYHIGGTIEDTIGLSSLDGDVKVVKGVANLHQALMKRLLTPTGSLLLHPEYGSNLHNLFGLGTKEHAQLIEVEVEKCLRMDGRVKSVEVIESGIRNGVYFGSYSVEIFSLEEQLEILIESEEGNGFVVR